jgi:hypothetical protein
LWRTWWNWTGVISRDAPEIARVAAPVYFKIEPGTSEADIYKPWYCESSHEQLIREKVKLASAESCHVKSRYNTRGGSDDVVSFPFGRLKALICFHFLWKRK